MHLLVSVTSAAEARDALDGGADIVDVKNPSEGALGAPVPQTIERVRSVVPPHVPLSVAIGDMPSLPGTAALAAVGAARLGATYVKVGLWGTSGEHDAIALLRAIRDGLRDDVGVAVIAAAYADAERLPQLPLSPAHLPDVAAAAGVSGCLIDTAIKDGRGLFDWLAPARLRELVDLAHARGLTFAVAGGLRATDLATVAASGADIVGVRSAACRRGVRAEALEASRVRDLRDRLRRSPASPRSVGLPGPR